MACDDAVASRVDRRVYARTLLHVAELSMDDPGPRARPQRPARKTRATNRGADVSRRSSGRRVHAGLRGQRSGPGARRRERGTSIASPERGCSGGAAPRLGAAAARRAAGRRGVARGDVGFALDSLFSSFADSGFSGTVLVALGNNVVLEKGYGLADRELGIPATAETRYSAAGITKLFTAAAVLSLEAEGRLERP